MHHQIARYRKDPDHDGFYVKDFVYGAPMRPFRSTLLSEGVEVQTGGTDFDLPASAVVKGDILGFRGQFFKVKSLSPSRHARVLAESVQVRGEYPEYKHIAETLEFGGETLEWNGEPLEWGSN